MFNSISGIMIEKRERKPKLSTKSMRALFKYARKNRFKSATAIAYEFIESTGLTISTTVVCLVVYPILGSITCKKLTVGKHKASNKSFVI